MLETIRMSAGANCIMRPSSPRSDEIESELSQSVRTVCERNARLSIMVRIHTETEDYESCMFKDEFLKLKYLFNFKDRDESWHFLCFETILLFCQYWQHKYCG